MERGSAYQKDGHGCCQAWRYAPQYQKAGLCLCAQLQLVPYLITLNTVWFTRQLLTASAVHKLVFIQACIRDNIMLEFTWGNMLMAWCIRTQTTCAASKKLLPPSAMAPWWAINAHGMMHQGVNDICCTILCTDASKHFTWGFACNCNDGVVPDITCYPQDSNTSNVCCNLLPPSRNHGDHP